MDFWNFILFVSFPHDTGAYQFRSSWPAVQAFSMHSQVIIN